MSIQNSNNLPQIRPTITKTPKIKEHGNVRMKQEERKRLYQFLVECKDQEKGLIQVTLAFCQREKIPLPSKKWVYGFVSQYPLLKNRWVKNYVLDQSKRSQQHLKQNELQATDSPKSLLDSESKTSIQESADNEGQKLFQQPAHSIMKDERATSHKLVKIEHEPSTKPQSEVAQEFMNVQTMPLNLNLMNPDQVKSLTYVKRLQCLLEFCEKNIVENPAKANSFLAQSSQIMNNTVEMYFRQLFMSTCDGTGMF